jgi:two-component system NtrC family sensor kinase
VRRRRERYTRQGQQRVIDIQVLPLTSRRHHIDQIIVHVVDVTEQLQLETMAAQNEQFVATGRLAMTVAHELNTPLLSIQSCLYMADKADAAARKVYLDLAQEEIQRISTILEQLLDLHRSHSDTTTQVDVNALIERVILLMSGMLAKHQVVVERALAADLPLLRINAYHLRQVLLNLILNAIDDMPTGGSLRISTAVPADGTSLLLTVADTGTGIAPDTQASIFEPFFTTKSHGSGLGLAISQKLMAHYGGEISVQSAPGAGSTFTVRLPMWQS